MGYGRRIEWESVNYPGRGVARPRDRAEIDAILDSERWPYRVDWQTASGSRAGVFCEYAGGASALAELVVSNGAVRAVVSLREAQGSRPHSVLTREGWNVL